MRLSAQVAVAPPDTSRLVAPALMLGIALAVMLAPVVDDFVRTVWRTGAEGHRPMIIAVSLWLLWQRRDSIRAAANEASPAGAAGWLLLALGLLIYVVGRVQNIAMFQMGSGLPVMVGALAVTFGWNVVRTAAFPLFFLLFAVPLPGSVVAALTQPLKQAVSWAAEQMLFEAGYPIARTGVVLMVGQYQLLVADACAGLNSMFTLEALGLLYMNLIGHTSRLRNVLLAILIVPMSFFANVVRVIVLALVTYHFGDEVGQGFVHGAAGILLFIVGMSLMFAIDALLEPLFRWKGAR